MKKETLISALPSQAVNFVNTESDTYDKLLKKLLDYFELNPQHKLTKLDIAIEKETQVKGVSVIKDKNKKGANDEQPVGEGVR